MHDDNVHRVRIKKRQLVFSYISENRAAIFVILARTILMDQGSGYSYCTLDSHATYIWARYKFHIIRLA